ncbi:MAG: hypothetical protein AAGJ97_00085 [Planctomycetota bacterium]
MSTDAPESLVTYAWHVDNDNKLTYATVVTDRRVVTTTLKKDSGEKIDAAVRDAVTADPPASVVDAVAALPARGSFNRTVEAKLEEAPLDALRQVRFNTDDAEIKLTLDDGSGGDRKVVCKVGTAEAAVSVSDAIVTAAPGEFASEQAASGFWHAFTPVGISGLIFGLMFTQLALGAAAGPDHEFKGRRRALAEIGQSIGPLGATAVGVVLLVIGGLWLQRRLNAPATVTTYERKGLA